jgi:hypothetical protein
MQSIALALSARTSGWVPGQVVRRCKRVEARSPSLAAATLRCSGIHDRTNQPVRPASSMAAAHVSQPALNELLHGDVFFLDSFALRQWDDPAYGGTRVSLNKAEFVSRVHVLFKEQGCQLSDGYAPFCKVLRALQLLGRTAA